MPFPVITLPWATTINTPTCGGLFIVTLIGPTALLSTPSGLQAGVEVTWEINQDNIGGRLLTFDSGFK